MSQTPDRHQPIADQLRDTGWVVCPAFTDASLTADLRADALALHRAGAFRAAGVGQGADWRLKPDLRGDAVLWLDAPHSPPQARYLAEIERLRLAINRTLFLGLWGFEGHYARYAPGSRYARHLDQFSGAKHRVVSCILYLNEDWVEADGGHLRLYLEGDQPTPYHDVLPIGGTLVVFLSDTYYHEVLPANRERLSLTGWFRLRSDTDQM